MILLNVMAIKDFNKTEGIKDPLTSKAMDLTIGEIAQSFVSSSMEEFGTPTKRIKRVITESRVEIGSKGADAITQLLKKMLQIDDIQEEIRSLIKRDIKNPNDEHAVNDVLRLYLTIISFITNYAFTALRDDRDKYNLKDIFETLSTHETSLMVSVPYDLEVYEYFKLYQEEDKSLNIVLTESWKYLTELLTSIIQMAIPAYSDAVDGQRISLIIVTLSRSYFATTVPNTFIEMEEDMDNNIIYN